MATKLPILKKKLWKVFSLYIRERDSYTCFTCGAIASGGGMHAGHFIPRSVGGMALYFHEDNVHAQCAKCNLFLQGNIYEYGKRLGSRRANALIKLKSKVVQWSSQDYLDKIEYYKTKLKELHEGTISGKGRKGKDPKRSK